MNTTSYFKKLTDRDITVIVDAPELIEVAGKYGLPTTYFDEYDFSQKNEDALFMIISKYEYHVKLKDLWSAAKNILAHLAIVKFDNSPSALDYSLQRLLSCDHNSTIQTRTDAYNLILSNRCSLLESPNAKLVCNFSEEVDIANDSTIMQPGWLYSIAEFFEASIVNLINEEQQSFSIEGEFSFDGIIYLCNNMEVKTQHDPFMKEIMMACSHGENKIIFSENIAQSFIIGGSDFTNEFRERFCNLEHGLSAKELALGCVDYNHPIDWKVNSLLNEGVRGAHIGIGMGLKMPHIDFISTQTQLRAI